MVSQALILNNQGYKPSPSRQPRTRLPGIGSPSPTSGSAPAVSPSSLQVSVNPAGLKLGVYEGQLTVNSSTLSLVIPVQLIVGPLGAVLQLSETGKSFQAAVGGPVPAAQTLQVSNAGTGNLTGLTATTTVATQDRIGCTLRLRRVSPARRQRRLL